MGQTCNPQGVLEPKICANGHYCPNGKEEILCPAGTFCPSGSRAPFNCSYGSLCPEGSVNQIVLAPLWVTLVLDVVLGFLVAVGFGISKWRKSRPKKYSVPPVQEPRRFDVQENAGLLGAGSPLMTGSNSPRMSLTASPASSATLTPRLPYTAHTRRSNGRVDKMDGYLDDDDVSIFDDDEI